MSAQKFQRGSAVSFERGAHAAARTGLLSRRLAGWITCLVVALMAAPAVAADSSDQVRANAIYKDAKEKFDAGDFQAAYEKSYEAEKIFAHPAITLLKGRALRRLGRLHEAEAALKAADTPQLPKPLFRTLADERVAVADEMRVKGRLHVTIEPMTAELSVDGEKVSGSFDRWVSPGKHRIEASAPERRPVLKVVEVTAGQTATIHVDLQTVAGNLVVVVPGGLAGVDVLVDGRLVDVPEAARLGSRTPGLPLAVGKHEVQCVRGPRQVKTTVEVPADATVEATCADLEPATPFAAKKAAGWGGVAVGAGLFGYGAWALGSYVLVDMDDPRYDDPRYQVKSSKTWGGGLYLATGAAASVLSYLFLVRDQEPAKTAASPRDALPVRTADADPTP